MWKILLFIFCFNAHATKFSDEILTLGNKTSTSTAQFVFNTGSTTLPGIQHVAVKNMTALNNTGTMSIGNNSDASITMLLQNGGAIVPALIYSPGGSAGDTGDGDLMFRDKNGDLFSMTSLASGTSGGGGGASTTIEHAFSGTMKYCNATINTLPLTFSTDSDFCGGATLTDPTATTGYVRITINETAAGPVRLVCTCAPPGNDSNCTLEDASTTYVDFKRWVGGVAADGNCQVHLWWEVL